MAFRWFKKSDLVGGAIALGFMALLFLTLAFFAETLDARIKLNAETLQKSGPDYTGKIWTWRIGMLISSLFCTVLSWISYRGSRGVSD